MNGVHIGAGGSLRLDWTMIILSWCIYNVACAIEKEGTPFGLRKAENPHLRWSHHRHACGQQLSIYEKQKSLGYVCDDFVLFLRRTAALASLHDMFCVLQSSEDANEHVRHPFAT
jgi:hypothetical protein